MDFVRKRKLMCVSRELIMLCFMSPTISTVLDIHSTLTEGHCDQFQVLYINLCK